jgi:hypothetical protein
VKRDEVSWLTENIGRKYAEAIRGCETVEQLRQEIAENWPYCSDALTQANGITQADWAWAKKNARVEKHGRRVAEVAGCVLLPAVLMKMSLLSQRLCAPNGTVLIRLLEAGDTGEAGG